MNEAQKELINLTAQLWNKYIKLPQQHPCDKEQFCHALHICQHLIMIREARRNDPQLFYNEENNDLDKN